MSDDADAERPPKKEPDEECNGRRFDNGTFIGYCNRTAGWGTDHVHEGRCKTHGGNGGAPKGNSNAAGNPGGGAPLGNSNAMEHGLYMSIKAQYESFSEDERAAFKFYVKYYNNDRGLDDLVQCKVLAIAEVMRDLVEADLADSLYETRYTDDGTEFQAPKKTMLDAHQQYLTTIRLKQHYEGISRHPTTETSENMNQFLKQLPDGTEDS